MAKNRFDIYNESVIKSRSLEIVVLKQVQRELKDAPKDVLSDLFSLFDDLAVGKKLGMPISRPLSSVGKGLHELRLSGRAGEYRVF